MRERISLRRLHIRNGPGNSSRPFEDEILNVPTDSRIGRLFVGQGRAKRVEITRQDGETIIWEVHNE